MARRKNKSVNEFVNENLKGKVGTLMDNRRRLLAPFPVAAERIYRMIWTPEERAAIRVCAKRKEFLREGANMHLRMPIMFNEKRLIVAVGIKLRQPLPMPGFNVSVPYESLEMAQVDALSEWAPKWLALRQEQNQLLVKLEQCGKVCKTFGQLYRLWPDILSFMGEAGQQKVREAKVRSAYPESTLTYRDEDGNAYPTPRLNPLFEPEAFAPFTSMIAECLMLPEDNTTEVATVTPC